MNREEAKRQREEMISGFDVHSDSNADPADMQPRGAQLHDLVNRQSALEQRLDELEQLFSQLEAALKDNRR